jgi:hypothetical protein
VLFMTTARPSAPSPSVTSSIARWTARRSASPDCVGGVSTQMKIRRESASSSPRSVVNVRRSEFFAINSASPGSWIGTSPASRASIFSGAMSRATTGCPRSAKQAAVTKPTQPTPTTPIGVFSPSVI